MSALKTPSGVHAAIHYSARTLEQALPADVDDAVAFFARHDWPSGIDPSASPPDVRAAFSYLKGIADATNTTVEGLMAATLRPVALED